MIKSVWTLFLTILASGATLAQPHFNVLVYHHVATDTPASTTISPERFREHLTLLRDEGFSVVSIEEALAAVRGEGSANLPEKAVVLTFDDAYGNIYDNAFPMLKEFDYPFTIFVATDPVDQGFNEMLTWDELQSLQDWGVTIANHTRDHDYLVRHHPRDDAWLTSVRENIQHAQQRLESELTGDIPKLFAYPYGEYNAALKELLADEGYIGFAQHSGGIYSGSDFHALPRFAAAGIYANPETLLTKLNSHPMPVNYDTVPDMLIHDPTPSMTIEVTRPDDMSRSLNCFINGNWQDAEWENESRFSLAAPDPLSEGRHRFNCTAQARDGDFFYWYSQPWLIQEK
ncbi:polysaccharide deacetylase family protein [Saccharospirillum salsuginis]|uniref:Polysaccharide deacetylase n=1 Tax=Saccharospirillum salsuginis TaxID=418750 RepID=A0A918JZP6_9GAMM|nr:polysaccharide deacetylase family protein [Saccharospirillum salsuginis]GGX38290.1 polysaccharide deacetylase [Saccharospirillum salsuginis]